MRTFLIRK